MKKLDSIYNSKYHEDYIHVSPYKEVEEANIIDGKYKNPEPLYDPSHHNQLYSDRHITFDHNLEKYRMNKQPHKGKGFSNICSNSIVS